MKLRRARSHKDFRLMIDIDRKSFPASDAITVASEWKESRCYLLYDGKKLIGSTAINPNEVFVWDTCEWRKAKGTLYVASTAVLPKYQGKGYGKWLKEWQIRFARRAGFKKIVIDTRNANVKMRTLNSRFGFEDTRIIEEAYSHPVEPAIRMTLIL